MDDPLYLVRYYEGQVGGSLPGFAGSPLMYGHGIGSVISRLFCFALARPHLKTAAKSIASDIFSQAVGKMSGLMDPGIQDGSGGIMVLARKPRKRPAGQHVSTVKEKYRRGM